jgi:hypothetical protein
MKTIIILSCFFIITFCSYAQSDSLRYPKTVTAGVDTLLVKLSVQDQFLIKNTVFSKLISFHLTLGMWIRNNFGLWHQSDIYYDCCKIAGKEMIEPDDASEIIIEKLWQRLKTIPMDYKTSKPIIIDSIHIGSKSKRKCISENIKQLVSRITFPELAQRFQFDDTIHVYLQFNDSSEITSLRLVARESIYCFEKAIQDAITPANIFGNNCKLNKDMKIDFVIYFDAYSEKLKEYSTE